LHLPLEIEIVPTAREPTGLARSSRNVYLNEEERESIAPHLYQALCNVQHAARQNLLSPSQIHVMIKQNLQDIPMELQYVTVVEWDSGALVDHDLPLTYDGVKPTYMVAAAVKVGNTRILDNILL
jgi:pantoate--beta-alanine ligase